jgi:hypothetical protein
MLRPIRAHIEFTVYTPNPPLLDASATPERNAQYLANIFDSAIEALYKKRSFVFHNKCACETRHFSLLQKATEIFVRESIAPATWIAFICGVWDDLKVSGIEKKSPPIRWVYSTKMLLEKRDWFFEEESRLLAQKLVYTESTRDLLTRYEKMMDELGDDRRPSQIRAVHSKYFPENMRETLFEKSTKETRFLRHDLSAAVESGKWVW